MSKNNNQIQGTTKNRATNNNKWAIKNGFQIKGVGEVNYAKTKRQQVGILARALQTELEELGNGKFKLLEPIVIKKLKSIEVVENAPLPRWGMTTHLTAFKYVNNNIDKFFSIYNKRMSDQLEIFNERQRVSSQLSAVIDSKYRDKNEARKLKLHAMDIAKRNLKELGVSINSTLKAEQNALTFGFKDNDLYMVTHMASTEMLQSLKSGDASDLKQGVDVIGKALMNDNFGGLVKSGMINKNDPILQKIKNTDNMHTKVTLMYKMLNANYGKAADMDTSTALKQANRQEKQFQQQQVLILQQKKLQRMKDIAMNIFVDFYNKSGIFSAFLHRTTYVMATLGILGSLATFRYGLKLTLRTNTLYLDIKAFVQRFLTQMALRDASESLWGRVKKKVGSKLLKSKSVQKAKDLMAKSKTVHYVKTFMQKTWGRIKNKIFSPVKKMLSKVTTKLGLKKAIVSILKLIKTTMGATMKTGELEVPVVGWGLGLVDGILWLSTGRDMISWLFHAIKLAILEPLGTLITMIVKSIGNKKLINLWKVSGGTLKWAFDEVDKMAGGGVIKRDVIWGEAGYELIALGRDNSILAEPQLKTIFKQSEEDKYEIWFGDKLLHCV